MGGRSRRLADLEVASGVDHEPLFEALVGALVRQAASQACCLVTFDAQSAVRLRARFPKGADRSWLDGMTLEDGDVATQLEAACKANTSLAPRAFMLELDGDRLGAVILGWEKTPGAEVLRRLGPAMEMAAVAMAAVVRKEKATRRLERMGRYRDLFMGMWSNSGDAVIVLDLDGRVLMWNDTATRVFGWKAEDVMGSEIPEVSPGHLRVAVAELRQAASSNASECSVPIAHRNGNPLTVHAATISVPDLEGSTASIVLISRVLTADDPLDKTRGDMVAGIAERMKPPLTAITGYCQLLGRPAMLEDTVRRAKIAQSMETHAAVLASLVEDLQLFAQVRRGELRLDIEEVDLASAVTDVASRLGHECERGFCVEAAGPPQGVLADRRRVEQALTHLLRATSGIVPDGGDIRLRVGGGRDQATLEVCVGGCVLPSEEASRLFARSFRLPQESGVHDAASELFIAQAIAEAHGGSLISASAPGEDLLLRMALPRGPGALGNA